MNTINEQFTLINIQNLRIINYFSIGSFAIDKGSTADIGFVGWFDALILLFLKGMPMTRYFARPLLTAILVFGAGIGQANAAFVTFFDKPAFLTATGATQATLPYNNGAGSTLSSGTITFSQGPNGGTLWLDREWTPLLPGYDLAISGNEDLNVKVASPVFALGFDFVEPGQGADSTFSVKLLRGTTEMAYFTFSAPNDIAYFIGIQSDAAFDGMQIRETVGGIDDEFFGKFYSSSQVPLNSVPEPASLALLGLGLAGLTVATRRRRV